MPVRGRASLRFFLPWEPIVAAARVDKETGMKNGGNREGCEEGMKRAQADHRSRILVTLGRYVCVVKRLRLDVGRVWSPSSRGPAACCPP